MDVNTLREHFPDEAACRRFIEKAIWPEGRICPHCSHNVSWGIKGRTARPGLYQCANCRRQFTVTTKTPMHSTKLDLWQWIQAMYYMTNSSKGVSSMFISRWLGIAQKSAWKVCHAIRQMMDPGNEHPLLTGVVELDEKYLGGTPRKKKGVSHKRGKGTAKQPIFVAVQRHGPAYACTIENDSAEQIHPLVKRLVRTDAQLMTDQNPVYREIGEQFASHAFVNHGDDEFARDGVHNNTAESFNALVERVKYGTYHRISKRHMLRYLHEIAFRWSNREEVHKTITKGPRAGKAVTFMKSIPILEQLGKLFVSATGRQLRFTKECGIMVPSTA